MVAVAVMTTQAMFNGSAIADQRGDAPRGDLKQRVADLEDRQDENDLEFVLVDRSLGDLHARIDGSDGRLIVHKGRIRALQNRVKSVEKRLAVQRADHRDLVSSVAKMRNRR
jgi:hypothetical protein